MLIARPVRCENKDYQDLKDAVKTIEKIGVYPVLNIRINGRLF